MPTKISAKIVEHLTTGLIGAFQGTTVTSAEAVYKTAAALAETVSSTPTLQDSRFPPTMVRQVICDAWRTLVQQILKTPNHPRRRDYVTLLTGKGHGDTIGGSSSSVGDVYVTVGGVVISLHPRSDADVDRVRANINGIYLTPQYYYAITDGKLSTTVDNVSVEIFDANDPYTNYTDMQDLFADFTANLTLGPEFQLALTFLATGILLSAVLTQNAKAQSFFAMYTAAMRDNGVEVQQPLLGASPRN